MENLKPEKPEKSEKAGHDPASQVGVVIIGRNEGERLINCILSVKNTSRRIVYVDSASEDGSVTKARELGVDVVELDMSLPFTAARARNAGFEKLVSLDSSLQYVQFVDGDCMIDPDWISFVVIVLGQNPDAAVVCGRRRERFPQASVYNYLCDVEWDTPIGEARACGGDFLARIDVLRHVGGFNGGLIAGEEPELCYRIRNSGYKVLRVDREMTLHDANMTRIGQWWKRNVRAGHAYAEGRAMYGNSPERFRVAECRRISFWALVLPLLIVLLALIRPVFLLLVFIYPLQVIRVAFHKDGISKRSLQYAFFNVLGKFPELQGILLFKFNELMKVKAKIIEYK